MSFKEMRSMLQNESSHLQHFLNTSDLSESRWALL